MANNELPIDKIHSQGMLRIHGKTGQLRYSPNGPTEGVDLKQGADSFVQPISHYLAGTSIKAGMPISVALATDVIHTEVAKLGKPSVVLCSPSEHAWCVGLAQEPGEPVDYAEPVKRYVHALNNGKFTWDESKIGDENIQFPPLSGSKFAWTKDDVGRQVYVSNAAGSEGQLTLEISEAYANGGKIITVGYLADAPSLEQTTNRVVTVEVRTAGDTRSMLDNTEFDVVVSSGDGSSVVPNPNGNSSGTSEIRCVKFLYDSARGITYAKVIIDDEDVLSDPDNGPIAAFEAKPDINYNGKNVVVTRLGIIEGKFGFQASDVGKDLWLMKGRVTTTKSSSTYEYKVGVVFDVSIAEKQRVLVDCRYPRVYEGYEPVGKVKPLYMASGGQLLTDPGYVAVDPDAVQYVRRPDGSDPTTPEYRDLAKVVLSQGIASFYDSSGAALDRTAAFEDVDRPGCYFKFTKAFYTIGDASIGAQIKFSREGSPEEMHYVWPMKAYSMTLTQQSGGKPGRSPIGDSSAIDVTDLMNLGDAWMGATNLDDFEVLMTVDDDSASVGTVLSPGISSLGPAGSYQGYDWQLVKVDSRSFLMMVTNPDPGPDADAQGYVSNDDCLGVVWPGFTREAGTPVSELGPSLQVKCLVRRRPAFHSSLMLNQLYSDSSWNADTYSDGANLGILGSIMFGMPVERNDGTDAPYIDMSRANEFRIAKYGTVDVDLENNDPLNPVTSEVHALGMIGPKSAGATMQSISKLIDRRYPKGAGGFIADNYHKIDTTYDFKNDTESHSAVVIFKKGAVLEEGQVLQLNGRLTLGPNGKVDVGSDGIVVETKPKEDDSDAVATTKFVKAITGETNDLSERLPRGTLVEAINNLLYRSKSIVSMDSSAVEYEPTTQRIPWAQVAWFGPEPVEPTSKITIVVARDANGRPAYLGYVESTDSDGIEVVWQRIQDEFFYWNSTEEYLPNSIIITPHDPSLGRTSMYVTRKIVPSGASLDDPEYYTLICTDLSSVPVLSSDATNGTLSSVVVGDPLVLRSGVEKMIIDELGYRVTLKEIGIVSPVEPDSRFPPTPGLMWYESEEKGELPLVFPVDKVRTWDADSQMWENVSEDYRPKLLDVWYNDNVEILEDKIVYYSYTSWATWGLSVDKTTFVHTSGNEEIRGTKTFEDHLIVPDKEGLINNNALPSAYATERQVYDTASEKQTKISHVHSGKVLLGTATAGEITSRNISDSTIAYSPNSTDLISLKNGITQFFGPKEISTYSLKGNETFLEAIGNQLKQSTTTNGKFWLGAVRTNADPQDAPTIEANKKWNCIACCNETGSTEWVLASANGTSKNLWSWTPSGDWKALDDKDELLVKTREVTGDFSLSSLSNAAGTFSLVSLKINGQVTNAPSELSNSTLNLSVFFENNGYSALAYVAVANDASLVGKRYFVSSTGATVKWIDLSKASTKDSAYVIGTNQSSHSPEEVDFLCNGTDDSSKIQSAIDALESTGGRVVLREGTYYLDSTIHIDSPSVVLEGYGAKLVLAANLDEFISIEGDRCSVVGVSIDDANASNVSATSGITIRSSRAVVEKCSINLSSGSIGVKLDATTSEAFVSGNSIKSTEYAFHVAGDVAGSRVVNNFCKSPSMATSDGSTGIAFGSPTTIEAVNGCYAGFNSK